MTLCLTSMSEGQALSLFFCARIVPIPCSSYLKMMVMPKLLQWFKINLLDPVTITLLAVLVPSGRHDVYVADRYVVWCHSKWFKTALHKGQSWWPADSRLLRRQSHLMAVKVGKVQRELKLSEQDAFFALWVTDDYYRSKRSSPLYQGVKSEG